MIPRIPRRLLLAAVLAVGVIDVAAFGGDEVYFPLEVGATREMYVLVMPPNKVVSFASAERKTLEKVKRDGKEYFRQRTSIRGGGMDQAYTALVRVDEKGVHVIDERHADAREEIDIRFPLEIGKTWTSLRDREIVWRVVGVETVKIKNKTYEDCLHLRGEAKDGKYIEEKWIHKGVGDVKVDIRMDKIRVMMALREFKRAANVMPKPVIELATPTGWTKSDPQPLPAADCGFTVAYEHESGLSVTFYQYTLGRPSIPNDVNSPAIKEELRGAKRAIDQAVEFGIWQSAKEKTTEIITLGDTQQKVLWSQYDLTRTDGKMVISDMYVWARANTFFKLRCTSESDEVAGNRAVLKPLLTALGSASKPTTE